MPQIFLCTVMGDAALNHHSNIQYRSPTFYYIDKQGHPGARYSDTILYLLVSQGTLLPQATLPTRRHHNGPSQLILCIQDPAMLLKGLSMGALQFMASQVGIQAAPF